MGMHVPGDSFPADVGDYAQAMFTHAAVVNQQQMLLQTQLAAADVPPPTDPAATPTPSAIPATPATSSPTTKWIHYGLLAMLLALVILAFVLAKQKRAPGAASVLGSGSPAAPAAPFGRKLGKK